MTLIRSDLSPSAQSASSVCQSASFGPHPAVGYTSFRRAGSTNYPRAREMATKTNTFYEQAYAVVRRVPPGQVTSYGRVAQMLGHPNAARAVGYAMAALRGKAGNPVYDAVPWHRVINSQGRISSPNPDAQAALLRAEGVAVSPEWRVDLDRYLWGGLHLVEIDDILNRETDHPDSLL